MRLFVTVLGSKDWEIKGELRQTISFLQNVNQSKSWINGKQKSYWLKWEQQ